ncbi:MAG: glycine--tRNA ligase subunit beta [Campylobacter sp.]|nr:glycine--tRNA ligase subunit beta [Campylobacter sp.]
MITQEDMCCVLNLSTVLTDCVIKFKEINGKEVLYHKSIQKGAKSREILPVMINEFLQSLNFGKSMRWGTGEFEFIRPVRSVACLFGSEFLDFEIFGVKSQNGFFPHRNFGYDLIKFNSSSEYFSLLAKNGVILNSSIRKAKILDEFEKIEQETGFKIEIDEDLLDEVVAITEYPTALLGEFESVFLSVPKEVIITSMKENQRYFPVFKNGELSNHFVVVSNAISDDSELIVKGNEKVLRARLSDAKFFWESDLNAEFNAEKLKSVAYLNELGSVYDKELREVAVAKALAKRFDSELRAEFVGDYKEALERAVMLSKADLTSTMVGEFSELQGIMGSYYAKTKNEHALVAKAIKEQYLPSGENSELPSGIFSSVVAMAVKFETLFALFSIDKIPSGNKDPYALRRAALGIIKIALNSNLNLDIKSLSDEVLASYKKFDTQKLLNFIKDRLYTLYDFNPSVVKACINSGENDIKKLDSAINALGEISVSNEFKDNFATFKRLANIIKDEKIGSLDESLFENDAEKALNSAFKEIKFNGDYKAYLNSLFGLKGVIDEFFDKVMINVDDPKIKANRIANIGQIYNAFLKVADIKEISF